MLKFFEQTIHRQFERNPSYRITPNEYWVETCLEDVFHSWKTGGYNFARWLNDNDRQLFDNEDTIQEIILYNNRYFKTRYNYNWMYQVSNLCSETAINTYAWICACNEFYDTIADIVHAKTKELITEDVPGDIPGDIPEDVSVEYFR
jgi:hypothetical protein